MWVASTVVIGAAALVLALNFWIVFSQVVNVRGVEPNVLHSIQKLLAHEELYADPAAAPFDVVQYTPLYYYAVAGLARATGISDGDVGRLYVLARLVSISFLIASLVLAQVLVMALTGGARAAAIVSSAVLAIVTSPWQALARPDAMTAFLLMVMLYAVVRSFLRAVADMALDSLCRRRWSGGREAKRDVWRARSGTVLRGLPGLETVLGILVQRGGVAHRRRGCRVRPLRIAPTDQQCRRWPRQRRVT